MSYVDALHDQQQDRIYVVERINGKRIYNDYPAEYTFYYDDPAGKYRTIYGTPVTRITNTSKKAHFKDRKLTQAKLWESDLNPVFQCLSKHYKSTQAPKLQTCFFDIEVDFDKKKGYADPSDPFNMITSITLYLDWLQELITLAVPPKGMGMDEAIAIGDRFDNTFMFEHEEDMLDTFLKLIADADVLSGWNSEGYDIPYTINRITKILSKNDTRRMCLWDAFPRERTFERFGKESQTFDLIGRVHMDYMQLYRRYTYEERHSYSLDAIGEYELEEKKVAYDGSLDELYNKDFEKFLDYNRQDVMIIVKLDLKLKFMDIANQLAHENGVLMMTTMGTVAVTEQAIINHAHDLGLVVPDRPRHDSDTTHVAGAFVAVPKKGLHNWIGSVDINSLYPSAIRMLNMSPESVVGQLRLTHTKKYLRDHMDKQKGKTPSITAAWDNVFGTLEYQAVMEQKEDVQVTIDWEDGNEDVLAASDVYKLIFRTDKAWCLTANGTILRTDKKGIIPDILESWYSDRKKLQAKKREATEEEDIEFWDKRQHVKKINLNSLYGALLNPGCRFFDQRIGQSTTLSGRSITRFMIEEISELLGCERSIHSDVIVYGDTDSSYFTAWPILEKQIKEGTLDWGIDECVQFYDTIADRVNDAFPTAMMRMFHVPKENGEIIKCGREAVATKGLFLTKKRYGLMIADLEGKRFDADSMKTKAMGMDLKRADTPEFMQKFLMELLTDVLQGATEEEVKAKIKEFRDEFRQRKPWEMGTPKRVNNLTKFTEAEKKQGKANMPGHVRAAMNWNNLKTMNSDNYSMSIVDGQKTIVCKLKSNPLGFTSVGYPIDEQRLPDWFLDLPFDTSLMEETILDQKVNNLLGVLNWNLGHETKVEESFNSLFALG